MQFMPVTLQRNGRPIWLIVGMTAAAICCAALSVLIGEETWASWFAHPGQPRIELTRQGAALWRIMLGISAVMLVAASSVWARAAANVAMATSNQARSRKRQWWMLAGIVIIAMALRALRINESLWYDEIASWMTYTGGNPTFSAVAGNFLDPINHPFHTLLNFISVRWLIDSLGVEIAFRAPALIFSILAIPAMFVLGRAARGEQAGWIAATLAAVLAVAALEGVEARGYSMMIFFSAMMTWLLIESRSAHGVQQSWLWLTYAVICALGVWSQFVTAFVPIGHGVWLAWRAGRFQEWQQFVAGATALVLAATMAITLYSPMIPSMLAARDMFAAMSESQPTILGPEGWHALLQLCGSWYAWAAVPGLIGLIIGTWVMAKTRNAAAYAVAEASMIGLPIMLIAVAFFGAWMYARFTLFALPGAIVIMAIGIDALWHRRRILGIAALAIIAGAAFADLAQRPPKQPLRDAADYVREHRQPEDDLLVIGLAHPVLRIYAEDLNLNYSFRHGIDLPRQLERIDPAWVVVEYPASVSDETYSLLAKSGFFPIAHFRGWVDWTNGDVVVYRRK